MAFKKKKSNHEINLNLTSMIDITSFILLALAILTMTMKKEASLDNIVKLPPVYNTSKQDKAQLQIYILPARILKGGYIDPDSTGLVAFTGKGTIPIKCPSCSLSFRADETHEYLGSSLLSLNGVAVASLEAEKAKEAAVKGEMRPPAYLCSRCRYEISPYLKLDEIPTVIGQKKKEVLDEMVQTDNFSRERAGKSPLSEAEIKKMEDDIPLMIKADEKAFYGRILQVVNMAKDTTADIRKFAFITLSNASKDVMESIDKLEKSKKK